jgi:hypothetical protein
MAIKQMKVALQVQPQGEADVEVSVTANGVQVFNQAVPECGPVVLNQPDPCEYVQFDIDVPVLAPGNIGGVESLPGEVPVDLAITCTNGTIKIDYFSENFFLTTQPTGQPANTFAGSANVWRDDPNYKGGPVRIISQPLWNGQAMLDRYNIDANEGTGPGELLVGPGETLTLTVSVFKFNDTWPFPA